MATATQIRRTWRVGVLGAVLAAFLNAVLYLVGRAADVPYQVPGFSPDMPTQTVTIIQVVLSTFVPLAVGIALALVLVSRGRGIRGLQYLGGALALVSLVVPLSLDTDLATKTLLSTMHLVTGAVFVLSLERGKGDHDQTEPRIADDSASTGVV